MSEQLPSSDPSTEPESPAGAAGGGEEPEQEKEYPLVEHLVELRVRVVRAAIGVVVIGMVVFFVAADDLLAILQHPLQMALERVRNSLVDTGISSEQLASVRFVILAPAEFFLSKLKVGLVAGVFLASPWVTYQAWLFVAPGLYKHERRYVSAFVLAGAFFFCTGGIFAFFMVFPGIFEFFIKDTLTGTNVTMNLSIAQYLSFSLKLLLAFGVAFQAPVVVFILSVAGIVHPSTLAQYRAYVVVGGFVFGAMLTPPDILSQTLLAVPMLLLFELGLLAARIALKFQAPSLRRSDHETSEE